MKGDAHAKGEEGQVAERQALPEEEDTQAPAVSILKPTPTLDKLHIPGMERAAAAMQAITELMAIMKTAKAPCTERGWLTCPSCKGRLIYSFQKTTRRVARPNCYAAKCETPGCITFSGH